MLCVTEPKRPDYPSPINGGLRMEMHLKCRWLKMGYLGQRRFLRSVQLSFRSSLYLSLHLTLMLCQCTICCCCSENKPHFPSRSLPVADTQILSKHVWSMRYNKQSIEWNGSICVRVLA